MKVCPNSVWPRSWTRAGRLLRARGAAPSACTAVSPPAAAPKAGRPSSSAAGTSTGCYGRNGWAIQVSYVNGYPHCSLTAACAAGDTTIPVNDCTGWAITNYYGTFTGATGRVVDSGQQEAVHVTAASVTAGPGTLTLSSALNYPHQAGVLVTTMPASSSRRASTSPRPKRSPGARRPRRSTRSAGRRSPPAAGARELIEEGELLIHAYRRSI